MPLGGQSWATLESLAASRFNAWRQHEPGIIGIGTQPQFAIGQRALLVQLPTATCCGTASRSSTMPP